MGKLRARTCRWTAACGLVALAMGFIAAIPAGADPAILGADSPYAIDDSYVVVLKDGRAGLAEDLATTHGITTTYTYSAALHGFAATMTQKQARKIAEHPSVAFIERNRTVSVGATQSPVPSWGLDRIDQVSLPLNNSYTYPTTAANVTAYIVDTGILTTHTDFGGRASWGTTTTGDGINSDCNGHGTHVAGTVGGNAHGVAKGVRLVAVKVLNCSGQGTIAGVIAGVEWVTAHRVQPAVANMSLGASASAALDQAVQSSIAAGVSYAVAAGNSNADACATSPARVAQAITVAATDRNDVRASFSNYGTCVDVFAPGMDIVSTWNSGPAAVTTLSGTSMASPHVAGAAALYLAGNPGATPGAVASAIISASTTGQVVNPGPGSPNRLLWVATGGPTPPDVTGISCESWYNQILCSVAFTGVVGTPTIRWYINGTHVASLDNKSFIRHGCTPSTSPTVRSVVSGSNGSDEMTIRTICRSGPPQ